MTQVHETAYPRLKSDPSPQDLEGVYTLTAEEINFFRVLQSIESDQDRFDGMCVAFGKLMYAHQVLEDMNGEAEFQSRVRNQVRPNVDDIPWGQE